MEAPVAGPHTQPIMMQTQSFLSRFFFICFFSPSLSPSEISQSDSLEKIEANAFDNLLNLSEM